MDMRQSRLLAAFDALTSSSEFGPANSDDQKEYTKNTTGNEIITMSKDSSYGSLNDATETSYFTAKAGAGDEDPSFDADQTYYLRSGSNLTLKQNLRKYAVAAVPIVLAALIMGFFTLYLLRNLTHLYPARGSEHVIKGDPGHTSVVSTEDYHGDEQKVPVKAPHRPRTDNVEDKHIPSQSEGSSSCSAHPNCAHLIGDCCPSPKGVMLDCCD